MKKIMALLLVILLGITVISAARIAWFNDELNDEPYNPVNWLPFNPDNNPDHDNGQHNRTDDWQYFPESMGGSVTSGLGPLAPLAKSFNAPAAPGGSVSPGMATGMVRQSSESIGFSVGGAKDINNFRDNIENDYLPIHTDVTYEGLFHDYYFDTGNQGGEQCTQLFCPSYSYAVTEDPVSGEEEYYLTVGLDSGMKKQDFQRKKLNLVVVLDISGSMSSPFNRYYYDQFGNQHQLEEGEMDETKMEVANQAVTMLLDHLEDEDRFGMVLFESQAYKAKPLAKVEDTDMQAIKDHVMEITPRGGTRMEAGMREATEMLEEYADSNQSEYENRIIFLTDAMPNLGDTTTHGLGGILEDNAENGLHTTFIGIGVDFNTEIVEEISQVRGANYYSVHSPSQFEERMDEGFDYMVTPLVFDLELSLDSEGYEIEKVYGSPEADEVTGTLMKVNTLFPSMKKEGEVKGGIILLKLGKTGEEGSLELEVSYKNRQGEEHSASQQVMFGDEEPEYFENKGIRKAVLLSRYADLVKNWIIDEREDLSDDRPIPLEPRVNEEDGIIVPEPHPLLGRWERQSSPLTVSEEYQEFFQEFQEYFEGEMEELEDDSLDQELDILEKLSHYQG